VTGTLYLVDLAGSESVKKTGATGSTLEQAKSINQSLSTLRGVIDALNVKQNKPKSKIVVPYRESKLTYILKNSLGGNSKTCMIVACSPHPYNEVETLSTLNFALAVRSIKQKAEVNVEYTVPQLLKKLEEAEGEI